MKLYLKARMKYSQALRRIEWLDNGRLLPAEVVLDATTIQFQLASDADLRKKYLELCQFQDDDSGVLRLRSPLTDEHGVMVRDENGVARLRDDVTTIDFKKAIHDMHLAVYGAVHYEEADDE